MTWLYFVMWYFKESSLQLRMRDFSKWELAVSTIIVTGTSTTAIMCSVACIGFILPNMFSSKFTMWIDFYGLQCYTFLGSINCNLKIKLITLQKLFHMRWSLYIFHIFYLFENQIHATGVFQSNRNVPPSTNQTPEVYSAIIISCV